MSFEFRAAMRSLLLPVAPGGEDGFFGAAEAALNERGVDADKPAWLAVQLRRWKRHGSPTPEFRAFVRQMLYSPNRAPETYMFETLDGPNAIRYRQAAERFAQNFFAIHGILLSQHLLTHDGSRQLLSHTGMLTRLAVEERMTASEISRLLAIKDGRFNMNWKAVNAILQRIAQAPAFSLNEVQDVFEADEEAEPQLLGDLDIPQAIEHIASIAQSLGCQGDFNIWLKDLLISDFHAPYLLILHYQLLIQAKFDHALTYAYEFTPRGERANWLTGRYIDAGVPVARSAFLNNAKATLRFDNAWVAGRTDHLRSATALSSVLLTMENLGTLAKDEIAAQIRGLLHRFMRLEREAHGDALPALIHALQAQQAYSLLGGIGQANTNTTGILEQRLVDCLGVKRHRGEDGWSSRGVGDSVFAANVYRKKFGDAEFELADRIGPAIEAYESHGGRLTAPYVEDHLNSFSLVLSARREDLEALAPLCDWAFGITFVAHQFDDALPAQWELPDALIELRYLTFGQAAAELNEHNDIELIQRILIDKLNSGFVHPVVRIVASELMAA